MKNDEQRLKDVSPEDYIFVISEGDLYRVTKTNASRATAIKDSLTSAILAAKLIQEKTFETILVLDEKGTIEQEIDNPRKKCFLTGETTKIPPLKQKKRIRLLSTF